MSSKWSKRRMRRAHTPKICKTPKPQPPPDGAPIFFLCIMNFGFSCPGTMFPIYSATFTGELTEGPTNTWTASGSGSSGSTWTITAIIPDGGGAFTAFLVVRTHVCTAQAHANFVSWNGSFLWFETQPWLWDVGSSGGGTIQIAAHL